MIQSSHPDNRYKLIVTANTIHHKHYVTGDISHKAETDSGSSLIDKLLTSDDHEFISSKLAFHAHIGDGPSCKNNSKSGVLNSLSI